MIDMESSTPQTAATPTFMRLGAEDKITSTADCDPLNTSASDRLNNLPFVFWVSWYPTSAVNRSKHRLSYKSLNCRPFYSISPWATGFLVAGEPSLAFQTTKSGNERDATLVIVLQVDVASRRPIIVMCLYRLLNND